MTQAKSGDSVKVHYTGRLADGTAFDSSADRDPLDFTIGEGGIIAGFEQAVIGMAVGESKTVTIPSDEAYGPRRDEMVQEIDRATIPKEIDLTPGVQLRASGAGDMDLTLTVLEVTDSTVTLDANHPLAGQDLTFDIELLAID